MTYGPEFRFNPFAYRELQPQVLGIIKGLELAPVTISAGTFLISQGIATVEPAMHIKKLMGNIVDLLQKQGQHPVPDK